MSYLTLELLEFAAQQEPVNDMDTFSNYSILLQLLHELLELAKPTRST
jgi:hypothetical protein